MVFNGDLLISKGDVNFGLIASWQGADRDKASRTFRANSVNYCLDSQ